MYELGTTSSAFVDDSTGAASLWMVPTLKGEAAASGSKARVEYLMVAGKLWEVCELPQNTLCRVRKWME